MVIWIWVNQTWKGGRSISAERKEMRSEFPCRFLGPAYYIACFCCSFLLTNAFCRLLTQNFSEVMLRLFVSGIYPAHNLTLMCYWIKHWLKCKNRYNVFQIKDGRIHIKNISLIMPICVSKSYLKLTAVNSVFAYHLMKVAPQEGSVLCNKILSLLKIN